MARQIGTTAISDGDSSPQNLRHKAAHGALVIGLAQVLKIVIQFASVVVLARLLTPDDFGVFAMATPVFGFAMLFQDLGLTQATIQRPQITQAQLTALFWVNFGVSLLLAFLLVAVAPLIGWFYGDARAGAISATFGLMMVANGLGAQHTALMNRHMRFGALAAIDAAGAAAGFFTSWIVALNYPSYWALAAGSFAIAVVPAAGAWLLAGWRPGPPRRPKDMKDIFGFGANVTSFNLMNFFGRNSDNVMIGKAWGDHALGLYDRAYKLLLLPLQQVNAPLGRVMLPILARLSGEPDRYANAYLRTLDQLLILVMPGVAFMIIAAPELVRVLLGPEWSQASVIFQALGVAALAQPLNWTAGWLLVSQGRSRHYMIMGAWSALSCIAAFAIGLPWGPVGVAIAYALSDIVRTPWLWWFVLKEGPVPAKRFLAHVGPHAAASLAALLASYAAGMLTTQLWPSLAITLMAAYGAFLMIILAFPSGRRAILESFELLLATVRRIHRPQSST